MDETAIKQQVMDAFAEDQVRADEIELADNGEIVIDRRATYPWAQPVVVGRWRAQR